ncbi:MAG: ABC transporter ATP-binding protein [Candidatus Latescibacterota bacterium]|jgi:ABC-2 type transport system ATP-binding protein|nr:MAG: ABC transporter ATP-binding protein [Candidatus Latescibacterota bacterium]
MSNILELRDVRKRYRTFALDGVSLSVPSGYIMGLIGPNGAGKTTTIRIIMNMLRPDAGSVSVFGLSHERSEREIKDRIGYVGEEQYYYEDKRISWTAKFVSRYFSTWDQPLFERFLGEFGLDPRAKVKDLSRGQKVKLSIAIAFSHHPELLVLDEPTSGLDPVVRREVLEMLMRFIADEKRSVLISSHLTEDIMRIADYVTYIVDGRIAIAAEKDEILANWKRIHFKNGSIASAVRPALATYEEHAFGASGVTGRYETIKEALSDGVSRGDVKVENVGLDDVLIAFVKGGTR